MLSICSLPTRIQLKNPIAPSSDSIYQPSQVRIIHANPQRSSTSTAHPLNAPPPPPTGGAAVCCASSSTSRTARSTHSPADPFPPRPAISHHQSRSCVTPTVQLPTHRFDIWIFGKPRRPSPSIQTRSAPFHPAHVPAGPGRLAIFPLRVRRRLRGAMLRSVWRQRLFARACATAELLKPKRTRSRSQVDSLGQRSKMPTKEIERGEGWGWR